jgi:Protein of unknown function (DUF3108)
VTLLTFKSSLAAAALLLGPATLAVHPQQTQPAPATPPAAQDTQATQATQAGQPVPATQRQQGAPAVVPFGVGERMSYEVRFGPMKVGSGSMEVIGIETVRGRQAWHTEFRVKGGTFFYKVNDLMRSWIDTETLSSLRYVQDFEEGGKDRERRVEIYPDSGFYVEEGKERKPTVSQPLDDGSFLYFVRTIPLQTGQTYVFDRYYRPERNPVRIRVVRRERISVPAGTYDAVVIQPIIKAKGIFSEGGHAEIWLSDDSSRVMLQMKSQLSFGSLNLYLKSHRPATANAASAQDR